MILECSKCLTYVCRLGEAQHAPDNCPMWGDFPDIDELYTDETMRKEARLATITETEGNRHPWTRWTRAQKIVEYARKLGIGRVGVAFCRDMACEATMYARFLEAQGIEPILPPAASDECDPLGQAELFNQRGTGLNALVGQCVGHDSLFIRRSNALVISLVMRDTVLLHNPVAALYTSKGYFHDPLFMDHRPSRTEGKAGPADGPEEAFSPSAVARIDQAAQEVAAEGRGRWSRIEESMEFARRLGAVKLGLVFCHGLREEAKTLTHVLEANGFQVLSVGCHAGSVPKERLGILDSEKSHPGKAEFICNSLAQAELLNRGETDLNLLMGQCVGHDSATMRRSKAPVVCLVAKDKFLGHNTVGALYREARGSVFAE